MIETQFLLLAQFLQELALHLLPFQQMPVQPIAPVQFLHRQSQAGLPRRAVIGQIHQTEQQHIGREMLYGKLLIVKYILSVQIEAVQRH